MAVVLLINTGTYCLSQDGEMANGLAADDVWYWHKTHRSLAAPGWVVICALAIVAASYWILRLNPRINPNTRATFLNGWVLLTCALVLPGGMCSGYLVEEYVPIQLFLIGLLLVFVGLSLCYAGIWVRREYARLKLPVSSIIQYQPGYAAPLFALLAIGSGSIALSKSYSDVLNPYSGRWVVRDSPLQELVIEKNSFPCNGRLVIKQRADPTEYSDLVLNIKWSLTDRVLRATYTEKSKEYLILQAELEPHGVLSGKIRVPGHLLGPYEPSQEKVRDFATQRD